MIQRRRSFSTRESHPVPVTYIHTRRPKAGKEAQFEHRMSVVIKSYWVMPFLTRKLSRWLNR
jgi:hypothetical protein